MTTQIAIKDIKDFVRRRILIMIITPILLAGISLGLSYWMTPKYQSTISILVQKEETLNPLISYNMAVNLASEDRLRSFNEIIYSRATIELFIKELGLNQNVQGYHDKQKLIRDVRGHIRTSFRASDSFDITYIDSEPIRAKQGVEFLANHFINTRLDLENRRNEETVTFFEEKLAELGGEVREREKKMLELKSSRMQISPSDYAALQSRVEEIMDGVGSVEWNIKNHQNEMRVLKSLPDLVGSREGFQSLYELQLSGLPFSDELRNLMKEYDNLLNTYTSEFPAVKKKEQQILELVERMPLYIESKIRDLQQQRTDLQKHKNVLLETMNRVYVDNQQSDAVQSDYGIYKGIYDDMKVKLEQARTNRDLSRKATNQFIVIDPAYIPEEPVSPNRKLMGAAGFFMGAFIGLISAVLIEFMDTSVRSVRDLGGYRKPVIAYLPELK